MMKSVFSRISQPDSTATAAISRAPIGARLASQPRQSVERETVMMCENVYQSERCCEFSALATTPCQSFT